MSLKTALTLQFSKSGTVIRSLATRLLPTQLLLGWVCGIGEAAGIRDRARKVRKQVVRRAQNLMSSGNLSSPSGML